MDTNAVQQEALKGFSPEQHSGLHPALKWGPAFAELADAITTRQALHQGGREANPILEPFADNDPLFFATKVGTGILAGLLGDHLAKRGHPGWGKFVSGIHIAVPLGAAVHNATLK